LEQIAYENSPDKASLVFVGIADLNTAAATRALEARKAGKYGELYSNCKVFASFQEMITELEGKLDAVFIGVPPFCHGANEPGLDMELQCLKKGIHCFVEKPISCKSADEVSKYSFHLEEERKKQNLVLAVGYMFDIPWR
jgi:predicted dehydrogenase